MNTNLIAISGKKRAGKNTVARLINEELKDIYEERYFAYLVKKFASELTGIPMEGWESEKDKNTLLGSEWDTWNEFGLKVPMTRRMFMKKLGSDACNQNLHPNVWVNGLFQDWKADSKWLITDLRFPQEVNAVKKHDGITIRVSRPETDNSGDTHISETALDNYKEFDFSIVNNGTLEELRTKVRSILFKLALIG